MIKKCIMMTRIDMYCIWSHSSGSRWPGRSWPRLRRRPGRLYQWKGSPARTAPLQWRSARPPGRGYRVICTGWTQTTSGRVVSAINGLKVRHTGLGVLCHCHVSNASNHLVQQPASAVTSYKLAISVMQSTTTQWPSTRSTVMLTESTPCLLFPSLRPRLSTTLATSFGTMIEQEF